MIVLCTIPGKHGDILWSLPTVRAVGGAFRTRVDLLISERYGTHRELVERQPYIGRVHVSNRWREAHSESAWEPFDSALHHEPLETPECDRLIHLGYQARPDRSLPEFIYAHAAAVLADVSLAPLRLDVPWIDVRSPKRSSMPVIAVGWSNEQLDYKSAVTRELQQLLPSVTFAAIPPNTNWIDAAQQIASSDLFLGCCSALHVVACAVGTPALIVEPDSRRWDAVLYPFGTDGPRTHLFRASGIALDDAPRIARTMDAVPSRRGG